MKTAYMTVYIIMSKVISMQIITRIMQRMMLLITVYIKSSYQMYLASLIFIAA